MSIPQIAELLRADPSVLFITGAGISAESGVPTYRGVTGLYNEPDAELGLPIEELLSGRMFEARPELTWRYLRQIGEATGRAQPNRAHRVIAALEKRLSRVWVLTQNVDDLHQRAGTEKLIPIHGTARDILCTECDWSKTVSSYDELGEELPRCPRCSAVLRPDVVLFGESLPHRAVAEYARQIQHNPFEVVFSVGTSHVFPYIDQPVVRAYVEGRTTILVNPESVLGPFFHHHLSSGAVPAMGDLAEALDLPA